MLPLQSPPAGIAPMEGLQRHDLQQVAAEGHAGWLLKTWRPADPGARGEMVLQARGLSPGLARRSGEGETHPLRFRRRV